MSPFSMRGPLGRTVLPLLVMVAGFGGLYALTGAPALCAIWAMACAHVVLLMPWSAEGGRVNHTSVLFKQPAAASEREKARIRLDGVTAGMRAESAIVTVAVFALPLVALALVVAG